MNWYAKPVVPALAGAAVLISALSLTPAALNAQGWIEPGLRQGPGVVKLHTSVNVNVDGRIARVEVEEWFENRGGVVAEGDYLYPLSGEAVFAGYSLWQGDQELTGEMMNAGEARGIYEEIVRRRKDPALIELAGHGLLRARVFPIEPGQTRKITLRYEQILERAGDALTFRYAAGGRFGPGGAVGRAVGPGGVSGRVQGGDRPGFDANARPMRAAGAEGVASAPVRFRMNIEEGVRFRDPFSPTHDLDVERDDGRLTVRPRAELHGDLALFLPFARDVVGMTLATHKPAGEDGYFMLTLSPGESDATRVPRDVTVVVDVSGSMSGTKIEEAKEALRQLLGTLDARDRFRLVAFSSRVTVHQPGWTEATRAALTDARRWVDGLRADGGTAIADALAEAFRLETPDSRLPIVVFLTDGLPSVGERDPERIAAEAERARGRTRVFAFGVGYDVNTYLLDRLTAAARGTTEYVEPGEDVESALGRLSAKIRHPVLTDLALADSPVRVDDVYPGTLPDLFAGEELVILGRWREADRDRAGTLRIEGRRAGRTEAFTLDSEFPAHSNGNDFLPRIWASRKIGELTREIRLNGPNPELLEEIRRLALRYGVLTEYTAYLVQEPGVLAGRRGNPLPFQNPRVLETRSMDAAAPPQAAQGAAAVRAAEASRARREATNVAQLAEMDVLAAREMTDALVAAGGTARMVGGRLFTHRDDLWTDGRLEPELRVVEIEAFGDAWFELLRRLPELKPMALELERFVVAGERVAIRIVPDGGTEPSGDEITRIVAEFRGS